MSWQRRITGVCLSRDCRERASEVYLRRFCDHHGAILARCREELSGTAKLKGPMPNRPSLPPKPIEPPPKPPKPKKIVCRLNGCKRQARGPGLSCFWHRGIPDDQTDATIIKRRDDGLCAYGCGRPARQRRPGCEACSAAQKMVPTCPIEGCVNSGKFDGFCGHHAR